MIQYRREIDGLRALAVLPVVLFHAGIDAFSGGFVGVDVFFVISGFLITSLILHDFERKRFSLIHFYERRARRILPALFVVMAACIPLAWLRFFPDDLRDFFESLFAVPLFLSNHLFLTESGYFETAAELKPLLHTWSLAVEEQYYLIFPLMLLVMWRAGKTLTWAALLVLFAASLTLAQWASAQYPSAAFFLLPTRFWELLTGSLTALYLHQRSTTEFPPALCQLGGLVGAGLILFSIFGYSKSTAFPGVYALVPTLGTSLIIVFANPRTWVGCLLCTKAFVGIGLISYSAYLWHQPLFAFAREYALGKPSAWTFLGLTAIVFILATLSWHFVEKPFRDREKFQRRTIFIVAGGVSILFCAIGVLGRIHKGFPERFDNLAGFEKLFVSDVHEPSCQPEQMEDGSPRIFCELGNARSANEQVQVALFGDSHAARYVLPFESQANSNQKRAAYLGLGGCPPLLELDVVASTLKKGWCRRIAEEQLAYVKAHQIKTVVLAARWSLFTNGDNGETKKNYFLVNDNHPSHDESSSQAVFIKSLKHTVDTYKSLGARVFVVMQVPQQDKHPKKVFFRLLQAELIGNQAADEIIASQSVSLSKHLTNQAFNRETIMNVARSSGAVVINPDQLFCSSAHCLIGDRNRAFYYDHDHLSSHATAMMIPLFKPVFEVHAQ